MKKNAAGNIIIHQKNADCGIFFCCQSYMIALSDMITLYGYDVELLGPIVQFISFTFLFLYVLKNINQAIGPVRKNTTRTKFFSWPNILQKNLFVDILERSHKDMQQSDQKEGD